MSVGEPVPMFWDVYEVAVLPQRASNKPSGFTHRKFEAAFFQPCQKLRSVQRAACFLQGGFATGNYLKRFATLMKSLLFLGGDGRCYGAGILVRGGNELAQNILRGLSLLKASIDGAARFSKLADLASEKTVSLLNSESWFGFGLWRVQLSVHNSDMGTNFFSMGGKLK